jgi:LemA protein
MQAQIEGTENRITTARFDFNKDTRDYNTHISVFPNSFLAGFFGFKEKPYFKADENAKTAPKVEFNFNKK